jgi:hypothetical protein
VITWQGSIDLFGCPNRGLTFTQTSLLSARPTAFWRQAAGAVLPTFVHAYSHAPVVRVCVPYRQQRNLCCWVVQVIHSCLYKTSLWSHRVFVTLFVSSWNGAHHSTAIHGQLYLRAIACQTNHAPCVFFFECVRLIEQVLTGSA